jgi:phosphate transport system permease protein
MASVATTDTKAQVPAVPTRLRSRNRRWQRVRERGILSLLAGSAGFSVLVTAAIVGILLAETVAFFSQPFVVGEANLWRHAVAGTHSPALPLSGPLRLVEQPLRYAHAVNIPLTRRVSLREFLTGTQWNPLLGKEKHFGIWPLLCGTLLVTAVAMIVALPLGLVTAVYLSEYAPASVRAVLKPTLELLAGIPTVVFGFFALMVITPALNHVFQGAFEVYNATSAGLAVGILCLPIVCSLSEDALHAVPRSLREAAYGLGATRFEVSVRVVVPAALSGIVSAFLLAIARAVGETMIVALAAGSSPRLTLDPRQQVQTMTGYMAQMASGDVSNYGVEYRSMYAVAAMLFVITLGLTMLGHLIRRRFREAYA